MWNKLINKLSDRDNISTFSLIYKSSYKNEVPARFNLQLVYGSLHNTEIDASINQSLYNNELFLPKTKRSFAWCQLINDKKYKSNLSICFIDNINITRDQNRKVELDFYDENPDFISPKSNFSAPFFLVVRLWIGIANTFSFLSVIMSTVALIPGRIPSGTSIILTFT